MEISVATEVLPTYGPLTERQSMAVKFLSTVPMTELTTTTTSRKPPIIEYTAFSPVTQQPLINLKKNNQVVHGKAWLNAPPPTVHPRRYKLINSSGCPISTFSVISFKDTKRAWKASSRRHSSKTFAAVQLEKLGMNLPDSIKRKKAESYGHHLHPSAFSGVIEHPAYNPYYVDDPELKTGKNRTIITLPCFMMSIIQYSRPLDLKRELNLHFKATHANVDSSLTLSMIRNLKGKLLEIGKRLDMEYSSIAFAYVYFEKLALKGFVGKANRRLIGCICLLLAGKVNDPSRKYLDLLQAMENELEIPAKEVLVHEFSIYAALEFTLFLPLNEIVPHLERILESEARNIDDYTSTNFYLGGC